MLTILSHLHNNWLSFICLKPYVYWSLIAKMMYHITLYIEEKPSEHDFNYIYFLTNFVAFMITKKNDCCDVCKLSYVKTHPFKNVVNIFSV